MEAEGKYAFKVANTANKTEIKQAISTIETKLSNDSWVNNTTNDVVITETLKTRR